MFAIIASLWVEYHKSSLFSILFPTKFFWDPFFPNRTMVDLYLLSAAPSWNHNVRTFSFEMGFKHYQIAYHFPDIYNHVIICIHNLTKLWFGCKRIDCDIIWPSMRSNYSLNHILKLYSLFTLALYHIQTVALKVFILTNVLHSLFNVNISTRKCWNIHWLTVHSKNKLQDYVFAKLTPH